MESPKHTIDLNMNCPSKTDPILPDGWNQNPNAFAGDLTTRSDLGRIANARLQRDHRIEGEQGPDVEIVALQQPLKDKDKIPLPIDGSGDGALSGVEIASIKEESAAGDIARISGTISDEHQRASKMLAWSRKVGRVLRKYSTFVGPGFMISVAYIDPGNYATDVNAGATYRFRLLFMVLLSNLIAIFLQSLCIKLGSVTGLNLAEMCKKHMPPWLNYILYFFAESAIIATDIAEVIGTAIALNLLLHIPLVAGCAISIVDVFIILVAWRPDGSMRSTRYFEAGVALLVVGVVICFCYQLSLITGVTPGEVFKGYLPSSALVETKGLYAACGILGATVMPHSMYLGSGIVQKRLEEYDRTNQPSQQVSEIDDDDESVIEKYKPSLSAIRSCMTMSIVENGVSLFTFALFVNSAILIVAGASLYSVNGAEDADLFGIHDLLSKTIAPAAGIIFALALLFSGTSAGIVCTMAGQMVSEGQLNWKVKPWVRRLMTRSISITPSIIIAGAVGKDGLSAALEWSQVVLSIVLPFISAPLIYFTCRNKYMTVIDSTGTGDRQRGAAGEDSRGTEPFNAVKMRNNWFTAALAVIIWLLVVVMNVALLVLQGMGKE